MLGEYNSDFYSGSPAVTVNTYGKGKAYCAAFASEGDFQKDFCAFLMGELDLRPDCDIVLTEGVTLRKRGDLIFVMNFSDRIYAIDFGKLICSGTPDVVANDQRVIDAYLGVSDDE